MDHVATTLLFGLEGLAVREVLRDEYGARVLHAVTDDPTAAACAVCGVFSSRVRHLDAFALDTVRQAE